MTTLQQFDMVIVGGGAVGSALALQLQQCGFRIAIIEAAPLSYTHSDPERIIALSHGSKHYLSSIGVWNESLTAQTGRIDTIDVSESGEDASIALTPSMVSHAAEKHAVESLGYVIEMGVLNQAIHAAIHEPNVHWLPSTRITAMQEHHDKVVLHVQEGEKSYQIDTKLLLAADGTQSQVRRLAGITTCGWDYNRFGLVCSIECEHSHQNTAFECFRNAGPLAFLPMADGRFSVVWALPPHEASVMLSLPKPAFMQKLQRAAGEHIAARLGNILNMGERFCFPLELRIAKQFSKPRIALIGNAAHTIHPVAGQGMNLGFRDAAVMAHVLSSPLAMTDPGSDILMRAYAEQRRLDTMTVMGFTESMLHGFATPSDIAKQLRNIAIRSMEHSPMLKQFLVRHAAGIAQLPSLHIPSVPLS